MNSGVFRQKMYRLKLQKKEEKQSCDELIRLEFFPRSNYARGEINVNWLVKITHAWSDFLQRNIDTPYGY